MEEWKGVPAGDEQESLRRKPINAVLNGLLLRVLALGVLHLLFSAPRQHSGGGWREQHALERLMKYTSVLRRCPSDLRSVAPLQERARTDAG